MWKVISTSSSTCSKTTVCTVVALAPNKWVHFIVQLASFILVAQQSQMQTENGTALTTDWLFIVYGVPLVTLMSLERDKNGSSMESLCHTTSLRLTGTQSEDSGQRSAGWKSFILNKNRIELTRNKEKYFCGNVSWALRPASPATGDLLYTHCIHFSLSCSFSIIRHRRRRRRCDYSFTISRMSDATRKSRRSALCLAQILSPFCVCVCVRPPQMQHPHGWHVWNGFSFFLLVCRRQITP